LRFCRLHGRAARRGGQSASRMSKLPLDRFLTLVQRSGLVDPDQLAKVLEQWRSQAPPGRWDDAGTCGEHLVEAGLLTAWQCQKLLEGRHRGFLLGNYKLLDHLGSGGMSNVYLAEHVLMQRRVAIKVLPQNRVADAAQLARFRFEGQAVAALDHPNIVRAYDLGCEGRIHYLVMEYIEGSDLEELVKQTPRLNHHLAADYIAQAAAGLEHAHGCGLVHRDIKPANLLVDRHGMVKILDMGLSKFQAEVRPVPAFARDEEVLGTAEYLAPEQAVNSLTVDHRADIYSLGCTLYFLLVGHPPFSGRTTVELMAAHQQLAPRGVLDERPDTPAELAAICQRMMQKEPADRYPSARDVRDALTAWLHCERASGRLVAAAADNRPADNAGRADSDRPDSAATRDTGLDVHETVRIVGPQEKSASPPSDVLLPLGESVLAPSAAVGSDVLATPPPPPTPPVVPPPRDARHASIPSVTPIAAGAGLASSVGSASDSGAAPIPRVSHLQRVDSSGGKPRWLWIAVLSALVLGAALLALVALAQ
jgi:serine/threonine protein kinase